MTVVRHYAACCAAELERIAGWINDADSALDQLDFDPEIGELRIGFQNAPPPDDADDFPKALPLDGTVFGRYVKQPYFRCLLTVRNAISTEPELAALAEPVNFGYPEIADDGGSIYIPSNTECAVRVFVSMLDVELQVTDEIAYYRKHGYGPGPVAWESQGRILE